MTSRILIVEDQPGPLMNLERVMNKVMPLHLPGFNRSSYDVARCFNEAKTNIMTNSYGVVLLDHRMPYENQVELEKKDFKAFCETLENIGYSLIPAIMSRNPNAIIVGTSSLSREELREFPKPDFLLKKTDYDEEIAKNLGEIMIQGNIMMKIMGARQ